MSTDFTCMFCNKLRDVKFLCNHYGGHLACKDCCDFIADEHGV